MSVNVFLDSNILIYTIDQRCLEKHQKARALLQTLQMNDTYNPVISTQVLNEFFNVTTKKLKQDKRIIQKIVQEMAQMQLANNNIELVYHAMDISITHHLTIWDALMVASSHQTGCQIMYSEDLHNGHVIDGVKILNPFI